MEKPILEQSVFYLKAFDKAFCDCHWVLIAKQVGFTEFQASIHQKLVYELVADLLQTDTECISKTLKNNFIFKTLTSFSHSSTLARLENASLRLYMSLLPVFSYFNANKHTKRKMSTFFTLGSLMSLRIFCNTSVWSSWQVSCCSVSETSIRLFMLTKRDSSPTSVTCFATAPDIFLNCG